ncbi:hypothetical protein DFP73DRAFT_636566 [Morchella snyderi]|nr:hypothetical protein DFP73DRAFT_636566 [Morchella snyderi]
MDQRAIRILKPTFVRKASENLKRIAAALNLPIVDRPQNASTVYNRKELGITPRPAITIHVIDLLKTRGPRSTVYRQYDWFGSASLPPSLAVLRDLSLQELTKVMMECELRPVGGTSERAI